MPCYTSVLNEVNLGNMGTGSKLKAALEGIGATVALDTSGRVVGFMYKGGSHSVSAAGVITSGASRSVLEALRGEVRVSYSAEIIKAQAKRNGWRVKAVGVDHLGNKRYQVIKGGF